MTLEDELPDLFHELADAHTVGNPPGLGDGLVDASPSLSPQRSRTLIGLTAACIALGVGGLVILSGRNTNPTVSDQPTVTTSTMPPDSTPPTTSPLPNSPGVAVVLAPPADSDEDWLAVIRRRK